MKYPFSGIIVRYIKSPTNSDSDSEGVQQPQGSADNDAPVFHDQLHVNLWELGQRRLLDIGVLIYQAERLDYVQIDIPWEVKKEHVFDLGSRLDNEKILAAIFNDVVVYRGTNDGQPPVVTFPGASKKNFVLLRLNSFCFSLQHIILSDGVICSRIKIKLPDGSTDRQAPSKTYIRFRVAEVPEAVYTTKFLQKDKNLLSSSAQTRIVDFRINVRRGIPDDVLAGGRDVIYPPWSKIHFFLTIDRERELLFPGENFIACRSLEDEEIWNSYTSRNTNIPEETTSVGNCLGYQWSAKAGRDPVKDMVALARFSQVTSTALNLVRFLVLALAIGAAGNGVWNIFFNLISPRIAQDSEAISNTATLAFLAIAIIILAFGSLRTTIRSLWYSYKWLTKLWPKLKAYFRD